MNDKKYAIITDNGGGENAVWHDVAGVEYTFQKYKKEILSQGTKVVYHRAAKKKGSPEIIDRLSDESHYFGVAEIGVVTETAEGNLRAEIVGYQKFQYPVPLKRPSGEYYEVNPFFQTGVRQAEESVYNDIVMASKVPPVPAPPKTVKRKGIKSCAELDVEQSSNLFHDEKYKIVTAKDGYYIYSDANKLYYRLEKPSLFSPSAPNLKAFPGKSGTRILIKHNGKEIGIIVPESKGVKYTSIVSPKVGTITVNM